VQNAYALTFGRLLLSASQRWMGKVPCVFPAVGTIY
jgi:hypothetical protein